MTVRSASSLATRLCLYNISAKQHCPSPLSVCTVYVCVCVCVCVCVRTSFAYLRLNPCLHYELAFSFFLTYIFIADNVSTSMYIMCVILYLFSALSCRVGALQISIIIITIPPHSSVSLHPPVAFIFHGPGSQAARVWLLLNRGMR